jgi:hypothetical protein
MTESTRGVFFWAPRILTILFALFLSAFALDVFAETRGVLRTLTAFVLHLVPTFLVLALLVLAWRWELIGVITFAVLAVGYVGATWGRFPWVTHATIAGPLLLISVLFFFSWRQRLRPPTTGGGPARSA